jgi:glutathione synthase
VTDEPKNERLDTALAFASSLGILMGTANPATYNVAPFSLSPCPIGEAHFQQAVRSATVFNRIAAKACADYTGFLRPAIVEAAAADREFTGRLLSLADKVHASPHTKPPALNMFRNDYMFDASGPKQVELNTIAASFGCLSTKLSSLHRSLDLSAGGGKNLPTNDAEAIVSQALAHAHNNFLATKGAPPALPAVVMMVVQPGETNSIDQRSLELALLNNHGVRLLRRSLSDVSSISLSSGEDLVIDGFLVTTVYFRAGYTPNDYPAESHWAAREIIEFSSAVKCPDIFTHLFGAKKIQQVLAGDVLRKYCDSDEEYANARSLMVALYPLGTSDDSSVIDMVLKAPLDYVLKPQREGGGNNLYKSDMVAALRRMSKEERAGYIVMELIKSVTFNNELVRNAKVVYSGECVCEMGVFGASLGETIITGENEKGFIVRCKNLETEEGGVAAGYAFLSSPEVV